MNAIPGIVERAPLAPFTTLGIGGPARWFAEIQREEDLAPALTFAHTNQIPIFILGGGSNLLIADEGFPGLVLRILIAGFSSCSYQGQILIDVGAGEDWDQFVGRAVEDNLAGIECLSGIPGSIGGTPVQNVGAYGQEVSETIVAVRAFDRLTEQIIELTSEECGFSYRASIFNTTQRDRFIVLSVTYRLTPGGSPALRYADLQRHFNSQAGGQSATPTLSQVRAAVREIRALKGMVIDPADPDSRSAGSFFKNPILTPQQFALLAAEYGEQAPSFPQPGGDVKIPAAWLIERAGFARGYRRGRAAISNKHTLALVNRGGATAAEIISLADQIKTRVFERFGVLLTPEPVFVGFSSLDSSNHNGKDML
jgi:UDP-N-acetylmuramate dehydrogenase